MNALIDKKLIATLACPRCPRSGAPAAPLGMVPAGERTGEGALVCRKCGALFPVRGGIPDLSLDGEGARTRDNSQKAMEFAPIVALYEQVFRPLVTKPFSDLAWEMETVTGLLDLDRCTDLLDLACGPGNFALHFARLNPSCFIVGADYSLPMIEKGSRLLRRTGIGTIALMRANAARWPFRPGSFDRIHCSGALHLFPDLQQVFHSIAGSLKPGGIFAGSTYQRSTGVLKRACQRVISSRSAFHWFEPGELALLAGSSGLAGWEEYTCKEGIVFRARKRGTS